MVEQDNELLQKKTIMEEIIIVGVDVDMVWTTNIESVVLIILQKWIIHTILKDKNSFQNLILRKANVNAISGSSNLIKGSGRAIIMLPNGTKLCIDDALYSSKSRRNLLSFKDICYNGYHIETNNECSEKFLYITSIVSV